MTRNARDFNPITEKHDELLARAEPWSKPRLFFRRYDCPSQTCGGGRLRFTH